MKDLWLGLLKQLGLAYWLTVTVEGSEQNAYSFGPFGTAASALSAQERCCRSLLQGQGSINGIRHVRISMEP
jgi:hypothetical protein